jgi:hypothetical protein
MMSFWFGRDHFSGEPSAVCIFGPQICYLEPPFDSLQKLWGLQQIVLFLKEEIRELTSGDELSGERK